MSVESQDYKFEVLEYAINQCIDRLLPNNSEDALSVILYQNNEVVWRVATEIYTKSGHQIDFDFIRDILNLRIEPLQNKIAEEERIRKNKELEEAVIRAELETQRLAKEIEEERLRKEREAEEARIKAEQERIRKEKEAEKRRIRQEQKRIKKEKEARKLAKIAEEERIKKEKEAEKERIKAEQEKIKKEKEARKLAKIAEEERIRKEKEAEKERIRKEREAEEWEELQKFKKANPDIEINTYKELKIYKSEVFAKVKNIIVEWLEVEEEQIKFNAILSLDLGVDNICDSWGFSYGSNIDIMMAIEEEFDIEVLDEEWEDLLSWNVGQLADFVMQKLESC